MANSGRSRGRSGAPRRAGGARSAPRPRTNTPKSQRPAPAPPEPPRDFVLGAIPGATPGKWIDVWRERMPHVTLVLREIAVADQRAALDDVDAALVRLPVHDPDDLHIIALYEERPVVVMSADSDLTAAEELDAADLAGEVVIVPLDDVLHAEIPDATAPAFVAPSDTAEAVATVAAGVGVVIMPMSLARAHQRRDVEYRVLRDGPTSTVALAWVRERTTADVEAFVGVVRGRTARSSR